MSTVRDDLQEEIRRLEEQLEEKRRRIEEMTPSEYPPPYPGYRPLHLIEDPEERIAALVEFTEHIGALSCGGNSVEDVKLGRRG